MAIEEGYTRYACDRSEKAHPDGERPIEFLRPEDKRVKDWHKVEYVDEKGVIRYLWLCPTCYEKWLSVRKTWDRDFREFSEEGN